MAGMLGKYRIVGTEIRRSTSWSCRPNTGSVIGSNDGLEISYSASFIAYLVKDSRCVKNTFEYHELIVQNTFVMDEELGVTEYRDAGISTAADIICTLLAPLLTTIPMFVLYFVKDIEKRLGIIMGFTMIFSIRFVSCLSIIEFVASNSTKSCDVLVCKKNRSFCGDFCFCCSAGCLRGGELKALMMTRSPFIIEHREILFALRHRRHRRAFLSSTAYSR